VDEAYYAVRAEALDTGAIRVRLSGELDLGARDAVREALLAALDDDKPRTLLVDLAAVTFIDSEAIGAILDGYVAAQRAGIAFRLINPRGIVQRVFEVIDVPGLLDPADAPSTDGHRPQGG
jgi:anti-anti-sigma factor